MDHSGPDDSIMVGFTYFDTLMTNNVVLNGGVGC